MYVALLSCFLIPHSPVGTPSSQEPVKVRVATDKIQYVSAFVNENKITALPQSGLSSLLSGSRSNPRQSALCHARCSPAHRPSVVIDSLYKPLSYPSFLSQRWKSSAMLAQLSEPASGFMVCRWEADLPKWCSVRLLMLCRTWWISQYIKILPSTKSERDPNDVGTNASIPYASLFVIDKSKSRCS